MARYCKNCGSKIDDDSLFCRECNVYVERSKDSDSSNRKWILLAAIVLIVIVVLGVYLSSGNTKVDTSLVMISSSNLDSSNQYSVLLSDEDNNTLANHYIDVDVDNSTYTLRTDGDGVASINLTLSEGSHEINSRFAGDNYYDESHTSDIVIK